MGKVGSWDNSNKQTLAKDLTLNISLSFPWSYLHPSACCADTTSYLDWYNFLSHKSAFSIRRKRGEKILGFADVSTTCLLLVKWIVKLPAAGNFYCWSVFPSFLWVDILPPAVDLPRVYDCQQNDDKNIFCDYSFLLLFLLSALQELTKFTR